jgi:hypothetical protein
LRHASKDIAGAWIVWAIGILISEIKQCFDLIWGKVFYAKKMAGAECH